MESERNKEIINENEKENNLIRQFITKNGSSLFSFIDQKNTPSSPSSSPLKRSSSSIPSSPSRSTSPFPCYLNYNTVKGYHLLSNQLFSSGQIIFTEKSLISIPTGTHSNRICWNCLKYGHTKIKMIANSNFFSFCSNKCLNSSELFVNNCNELLIQLSKERFSHLMIFCIKIIYQIEIENKKYLLNQIINHEKHLEIEEINELNEITEILLHNIDQFYPQLLDQVTSPYQYLQQLLRALQFNSQSHSIISLINTQFLCFYSFLSRLNHSCNANCILTYHISPKTSTIITSLVAIRSISIDEELTISYLSEYCQSLRNRQNLLLNGFQFHCQCVRCLIEEKYFHFSSFDTTNTYNNYNNNFDENIEENEIPTIVCNENSYYITDLIKLKTYLNEFLLIIKNISQKLQFLVILQNIFQQVNEKIQFLKLQWRSLLTTVTLSLTADRLVNSIQTKQIFHELNQIYQNFYYYYEINLLLFFYIMTEKNVTFQDSTIKYQENENFRDYQIKREIFLIEICKLMKFCWKLCYEFSEMKKSDDFSVGILWNSQSVIQILLTGGGAASRLITNHADAFHEYPEMLDLIDEGSQMIRECQYVLSNYFSFTSDSVVNHILTTIIPTSSLSSLTSSLSFVNEIKNDIKHEYSDIKYKIDKLEKMFN